MNFVIGRSNFSPTVFVPWDCANNCRFCTSKADYKRFTPNLNNVVDSIKIVTKMGFDSIVLTGGEPFANLQGLIKLLSIIPDGIKVYINTTLPADNAENIIYLINNHPKISAVNISRHGNYYLQDTCFFNGNIFTDEQISAITKPIRINCLVSNTTSIFSVIKRWQHIPNCHVVFRADYRKVTQSTLKTLNDPFINQCTKYANYVSHGGCDVCEDIVFYSHYTKTYFSYHRGLEKSSLRIGDTIIINDLIIKQDGSMYYDWDFKKDGINKLLSYPLSSPKPNNKCQQSYAIPVTHNNISRGTYSGCGSVTYTGRFCCGSSYGGC